MSEITPQLPRIATELPPIEIFHALPRARHRYWLHLLLLVLTFFTTLLVGTQLQTNFLAGKPIFSFGDSWMPLFPVELLWRHPAELLKGVPFSLTLMTILLAHEMGHYIYCLRYGVYATLPFFIPAPTLIGTMGAFIRIKSPIRDRTALFDVGIAGPIAGFVVATLVLLLSLPMSKAGPPSVVESDLVIGYPLIFHLVHWFMLGDATQVMPLSSMLLHPTAIAAWVGMFATAMNLVPGGQLDGGHIVYSLFPRAHRKVTGLTILTLVVLAWFSLTWLIWAIMVGVTGMRHPAVPVWPDLPRNRRLLAWAALIMLVLTFMPEPFLGKGLGSYFGR